MKFIAILAFLFSVSTACFSQPQILPPNRGYHVLSYHVTLDWRSVFAKKSAKFSGSNEMVLRTDTGLNVIVLDASYMKIDSILVDGAKLGVTPSIVSDTLRIALSDFVPIGSTVSMKVYYTHTSTNEQGLYYYPKGMQSNEWDPVLQQSVTVQTTEDLAYTMSEPLDAHKWMPCNDEPYNKAHAAISIIVPSGYSAQSNGSLAHVDTNVSDGSHTYHWVSDEPIATYLMVANASRWKTWQDYYHRLSNLADSVPVVYYCWPSDDTTNDESGSLYNAHYAYRHTPKMLTEFSKRFGEYPFIKYAQVPVEPFSFGGMEHQSITTIHRSWLRGIYEDGIAHELMHQWFGDKVTCETWADIWLNEGFATMGEWVWEEAMYGTVARDIVLHNDALRFFNPYTQYGETNTIPTYNPPISNVFNVQTTYMKGGLVLYMLRQALADDSLFFGTLRNYNDAFAYSTANTFQFRDYLEQHLASRMPVDPAEFINEWIFRPDWPKYNITWNQAADNTLYVKIDQTPDSSDHYTMPLRFFAIAGQDTTHLMFVNDKRSQFFSAHLDHKIDELAFDQLSTIVSTATVTEDNKLAGVIGALSSEHFLRATSTTAGLRLNFEPAVGPSARVELLDVLGRTLERSTLSSGVTFSTLAIPALPTGSYFVRLIDGDSQQIARVQLP